MLEKRCSGRITMMVWIGCRSAGAVVVAVARAIAGLTTSVSGSLSSTACVARRRTCYASSKTLQALASTSNVRLMALAT
jgi:hypothetical protein